MTYNQLMRLSKKQFDTDPVLVTGATCLNVFTRGAEWMHFQLNKNETRTPFNAAINYNLYGCLKYGICLAVFILAATCLWWINPFLAPLAIFIFYWCEVHFLFLFPLALDNVANPLLCSIRQAYKFGVFRAIIIVLPIGFFMIAGLFKIKSPLKSWHTGCLAILILYQHEVRNRV